MGGKILPPFKLAKYMINSCAKTKEINAFVYEAIPSPRDIYRRYGERKSDSGIFTSTASASEPIYPSSCSTIDSMVRAQNMISNDVANLQKKKDK